MIIHAVFAKWFIRNIFLKEWGIHALDSGYYFLVFQVRDSDHPTYPISRQRITSKWNEPKNWWRSINAKKRKTNKRKSKSTKVVEMLNSESLCPYWKLYLPILTLIPFCVSFCKEMIRLEIKKNFLFGVCASIILISRSNLIYYST